ncbi:MAG: alkaline phosphatase [Parvularculaceae bacterium]
MKITRRSALGAVIAGGAAACTNSPPRTAYESATGEPNAVFAHGVASGDPGADSVVLWTRATTGSQTPVTLTWELSEQGDFANVAASGEVISRPEADFTAKAVAGGLAPGKRYFYRFRTGDAVSPTGRTRTLPVGALDAANFAVISCSNYPFGYFNVYDLIARRDDLDAVIHLGDYIYEYGGGDGEYGAAEGARLGRPHQPPHELNSLADYRTRHAQYKADPGLQAAHAAHPFITIWDDHEVANDTWSGGAQNHDPETEGDWGARKRAALQAYYEWMPIREPDAARPKEAIFRSFSYGDLLTLAALETRLMARAKSFEYNEIVPTLTSPEAVANFRDNILWAADREMLGAEQLEFVSNALKTSKDAGQPWRLIANQVIMAKVTAPNLEPHLTDADIAELEAQWDQARAFVKFSTLGLPTNLDAWDGYPAARERFYEKTNESIGHDGIVVVTGDTHTWWANDLVAKDGAHVGVELGCHSITSPSPYRKEFLGGKGAEYALLTGRDNSDVRYISGEDHGYISLAVARDKIDARFIAVDTIEAPHYEGFEKAGFTIKKSGGKAQFAGVRGLSLKERVVF